MSILLNKFNHVLETSKVATFVTAGVCYGTGDIIAQRIELKQQKVNIGTDHRQHIQRVDVAAGEQEATVNVTVNDQRRRPAESLQLHGEVAGLGRSVRGIEHDELAVSLLLRQRAQQAKLTDLLGKVVFMAANHWAVHGTTGAELRRTQRALASVAGALLLERLLGRARNLAHALHLVGAGTALGQLPMDNACHDILARRDAEDLVRQLGGAGGAIVEGCDLDLHLYVPQPAASATAAWRKPAGYGASGWRSFLMASRTRTKPFFAPGTAPLRNTRPLSESTNATSRLSVVIRSWPRWPAIFLFLKVLPGS